MSYKENEVLRIQPHLNFPICELWRKKKLFVPGKAFLSLMKKRLQQPFSWHPWCWTWCCNPHWWWWSSRDSRCDWSPSRSARSWWWQARRSPRRSRCGTCPPWWWRSSGCHGWSLVSLKSWDKPINFFPTCGFLCQGAGLNPWTGNTKGGSIFVPLTSCLTGLD